MENNNEMKVIVNARFLTQPITGVQRFAIELSKRLKNQSNIDVEFIAPKDIIHSDLALELGAKTVGYLGGHLWEQIDLPLFLKQNGSPLLLSLCSTAPVLYKNQIVTHHDITYIRYPESFSKKFIGFYKLIVPLMLKNSKKIITVSEFSKIEISNYFKIPKEKFIVVYNGVDTDHFSFSAAENSSATTYILAVSSRNFHKNFHGLIKSFNKIKNDIVNIHLYIVGGSDIKSFNNVELDIENLEQEKRIHFLGRVYDKELVKLYQNASLFVFPSFYEGFGIPPLEAQACGCPVIASDKASMPEVLDNSVLYFDPFSDVQLSEKILFFYNNPIVKNELVTKGLENIKKFNWDDSVKILIENIKFNIC